MVSTEKAERASGICHNGTPPPSPIPIPQPFPNHPTHPSAHLLHAPNPRLTYLSKKTLVPAPRSFFMDVKCPGCFTITTVFSHAQTVVQCGGCSTVLCQPTGGKARLTEGCSFRRK
ncbi:hypothetical protein Q9189_001217 [Teloschistes chrysophthalmus]